MGEASLTKMDYLLPASEPVVERVKEIFKKNSLC